MAVHLIPDEEGVEVKPANKMFTVEELQSLVGGYFEVIRTTDGRIMVVNEDGRRMRLTMNVLASNIAGIVIVGNAVLCSPNEMN